MKIERLDLCDIIDQNKTIWLKKLEKRQFENECSQEQYFQKDVACFGDWNEGFLYDNYLDLWFVIEWIKVRPRYLKKSGRLIEPELIDATEQFEEILTRCNIPYEEKEGVFCIYGYR